MKKIVSYLLSASLLFSNITTIYSISLPFNKKNNNYTLKKFEEYDKEVDTIISDILLKTDFSLLYKVLKEDIEKIYEKISTLIEDKERDNDRPLNEKISNYKHNEVLLYKTLPNLNFISEENAKLLLISTLFVALKEIKYNLYNTGTKYSQNKSHLLNIIQSFSIDFKSVEILKNILKTIDLRLSSLSNPLDLDDFRYEYSYYKIIEKTVNHIFNNKKDLIEEFLDKWSQKTKQELKKDIYIKKEQTQKKNT